MHIWLVVTNLHQGGAERTTLNLSIWLKERGHDVRLILLERMVDYDLPSSLSLHFLEARKKGATKGWLGKQLLTWRLRRWAQRESADREPDLVISTLPFTDEIVHRAGLKNVWYRIPNPLTPQISALEILEPRKAQRRLARFRKLYGGANLITISEGIIGDLNALGIQPLKAVTIYNPFDFDEIKRRAALPEPDLPAEPYVIHAARFVPQKRHDVVLDAFAAAALPHRLVLMTRRSRKLEAMIDARGLADRVIVTGFRRNPFPWYARAAALIHGSDFEGFGNVLVEALACGTPVVSTDCPTGPREILTGDLSRFLSPPGDAQALARNLVACIEAPPKIDEGVLERFSKDRALSSLESLSKR